MSNLSPDTEALLKEFLKEGSTERQERAEDRRTLRALDRKMGEIVASQKHAANWQAAHDAEDKARHQELLNLNRANNALANEALIATRELAKRVEKLEEEVDDVSGDLEEVTGKHDLNEMRHQLALAEKEKAQLSKELEKRDEGKTWLQRWGMDIASKLIVFAVGGVISFVVTWLLSHH